MAEVDYTRFLDDLDEAGATGSSEPDLQGANEDIRQKFVETYGSVTLREIEQGMPVQIREETE